MTTVEILSELASQTEKNILNQISDLISRGILVIEKTEPVLTQTKDLNGRYTLEMRQYIKLVSKEAEYIKSLEEENKTLKEVIHKLSKTE